MGKASAVSILEVEIWTVADGKQPEHDESIREWFRWVEANRDELFPEWKSARYYREIDTESRQPNGKYIMMFEFYSIEQRDAYKARRHDWSGPYAEYKKVDPYRFFNHDSVTMDFWEPQEESLWLQFD